MRARKAQGEFKRIFVSDCEGPISKNDNAFELTSHYVPNGARLFTLISRYDDIQADIVKRAGYKAGDTLKLILPFLKAYGLTSKRMIAFSSKNIMLVPVAKEMLECIRCLMPTYMVSTSYQQYMCALCEAVDFPLKDVYCTRLDLDKHEITDEEKTELKRLSREMVKLPTLEIPPRAQSLSVFPSQMQKTVKRLDGIFWDQIPSMRIGKMLFKVNPLGGREKITAIKEILLKLRGQPQDMIYVGDSITDASAFELVRNAGGLTVSFNGNAYAVREAEVAVLSKNAAVTAVLASMFTKTKKAPLIDAIRNWKPLEIRRSCLRILGRRFSQSIFRGGFPRVNVVTRSNMKELASESNEFRKEVRGEAIGRLG